MKRTLFILISILLNLIGYAQFAKQYNALHKNTEIIPTPGSIELQLNISELNIDYNNGEYLKIEIDQLNGSMIKGEPDLPKLTKLMFLPLGVKPKINIVNFNKDKIQLKDIGYTSLIKPSYGSVVKSVSTDDEIVELSELYKQDQFLSNQIVDLKYIGIYRNQQVYEIVYYPVAYNPVKNTIEVFTNVSVNINWKESTAFNSSWKYTSNSKQSAYAVARSNNSLFENENKKTFLIVSPLKYKNTLLSFVYWKKSLGYNVIEAYIGEDISDASKETIKSYIKNYYESPEEGSEKVSYLLLVGDVADIPAWSGRAGSYATDLYYAEFTNDYLPELFYGRISVTTNEQLEIVIAKTLYTEKANGDFSLYQNNHLLVSGVDASYAPIYGNGAVKYIKNNYSNATQGITSSYYLYGSGSPIVSNSSLAKQSIIDDINNGVGLAYYTAHCATNGWTNPELETSDLSQLHNKDKYPFMIGNCCESAKFNSNSFAEDVVRAEGKGAVAYIGASDYSYWDEDYYWAIGVTSTILADPEYSDSGLGLFDAWFHTNNEPVQNQIATAGEFISIGNMAVQESNSSYKNLYWEIYHLIGDPTFVPAKHSYEQVSAQWSIPLIANQNSLTIQTVANAYVSLSENGNIIGGSFADDLGKANVSFNSLQNIGNKQIEILVSHPDYAVVIDSLDVIPPDGPYLVLDNFIINDSSENSNGTIEFNESVLFDLSFKNLGVVVANNIKVSLTTNNSWVDSLSIADNIPIGIIEPGNEKTSENSFRLHLDKNVPDKTIINFIGTVNYNDTLFQEFYFKTEIFSPKIVYVSTDIDVAGLGNTDGLLQEAELATLNVYFQNIGTTQVSNTTISFNSENTDFINVEKTLFPFGGFSVNEIKSLPLNVQVGSDIFNGSNVNIKYVLKADENPQISYEGEFKITLGEEPNILMKNDTAIEIVNGYFYDSGGPEFNYLNKENTTVTFKPYYSSQGLSVNFEEFKLESGTGDNCWDYLEIFDGINEQAPLIGSFCKSNAVSFISSQNDDGALTFTFISDGSQTELGWEAYISSSTKHNVTLKIVDGLGVVQNTEVTFNTQVDSTNDFGEVIFKNIVEESANSFSIYRSGYIQYTDELNNIVSDTLITVLLEKAPEICFSVSSGITPIQNARILFNNEERFTDEDGKVFFPDLSEGTKYFFIEANGFIDTMGYISVPAYDVCYFINMKPTTYYSVELLVYEEFGVVESANVHINGNSKYTNSKGLVTIDSLYPANFKINIFKEGYKDYGNMLNIPDSNSYQEIEILPKTYGVIFNVKHNDQKISEAHIFIKDQELITSSQGQALLNSLRAEQDIEYRVEHPLYMTHIGYFSIVSGSEEVNVNLDLNTTIEKNDLHKKVIIYPNPSSGSFTVDFGADIFIKELSIISQEGKTIYKLNNSNASNNIRLDINEKGLFFLRIITNAEVLFYPILVQ